MIKPLNKLLAFNSSQTFDNKASVFNSTDYNELSFSPLARNLFDYVYQRSVKCIGLLHE